LKIPENTKKRTKFEKFSSIVGFFMKIPLRYNGYFCKTFNFPIK